MEAHHDKILDISINYKKQLIGKCSYLSINKFAPESARDLVLKQCVFGSKLELYYQQELFIRINYFNKFNSKLHLYDFNFTIIDYDISDYENVKLYGNLNVENNDIYSQDIIDIFNLWQNKKLINWEDLYLNNSISKLNYLRACGMWSGLPTEPPKNHEFTIDCSNFLDEYDFYYSLANSLYGNKFYLGVSLYTLEDSLIEFYKKNKILINIKLKNVDKLKVIFKDNYHELISLMKKYKIDIR